MFYVLDENNNKVEAYDKQGVIALLEQAIADGDLESIAADSAFVDKLKCCVGTGTHHIAFVTQATYNELQANGQLIADAYYFITDDTTTDDINAQLEELTAAVNSLMVINYLYAADTHAIYNSSYEIQTINLGVKLPVNKTLENIQDISFKLLLMSTFYDNTSFFGISTHSLDADQTYIDISTYGICYERNVGNQTMSVTILTPVCRLSLDSERNILLTFTSIEQTKLTNNTPYINFTQTLYTTAQISQINIHLV